MAISSYGYTGAVNNVQWAQMAGSLGFDYVAKGPNDCKVTAVSTGTRTVRVATGSIAGGGVLDVNGSAVDIALPNVTSGSKWFMIVAHRVWQTTNATTFTYIEGTATRQLPPRDVGFGVEDDQPLALVRIAAGQTLPQEIIDLRVIGNNNGAMVGFDHLCLEYVTTVGTMVKIGDVEWLRTINDSGSVVWTSHTPTWKSPPMWIGNQWNSAAYIQAGDVVVTTNANGDWSINFATPFALTLFTAVLTEASGSLGAVTLKYNSASSSRTRITGRAYASSSGAALPNGTPVRIAYMAVGA